ncbi:MAG TPA: VTT domain-containing protein [Candidatus Hydrogenedentes bacterium]|nr:VTT domain-containing protein [Candidatus Hydrogenedentota bacterium]HRK36004.1 VTT domain-containing protein [Candidatus Hydrogenedentota bacterium]
MIASLFEFFAELDLHILALVEAHGGWTHAILFLLLTCEVGLVVLPFLPGETLLFAAGALAALDALHLPTLLVGFAIAATAGNMLGYTFGRCLRVTLADNGKLPFVNQSRLARTQEFFHRNPRKTLIVSRFIPIVRSIAPFVAGTSRMHFGQFTRYTVLGGTVWAVGCTLAGFYFGQVPIVRENLGLGVLAIVAVACLPPLVAYVRNARRRPKH